MIGKVKIALLAMQRYSWEQGVAAQAFLESGETEVVVAMANEAVARQLADGRLGVLGGLTAVTDPASNGEALLYASKITGEAAMKGAFDEMIDWLLNRAPKNNDGILYHFTDSQQLWVDSVYMAPPCLAIAGYHEEAIKQIDGFRSKLFNSEKNLYSHMWDESLNDFARKDYWGVGNGWALAGITRVIRSLPDTMADEKSKLAGYVKEGVDGCLAYLREDGLFHDVVDNTDSFVETNLSQMLAYTLYRGMTGGWLEAGYLKYAAKMRQAACNKVDKYGLVQGVCASPNFDRPGTASEGQAFFLLMEAAAADFTCGS